MTGTRFSLAETGNNLPVAAKLLLAVILVQLTFWLFIKPAIIGNARPDFESLPATEYSQAALAKPEYSELAAAKFEQIDQLPAEHCCEAGYRAFRYHVTLSEIPGAGLGIAPHIRADNFRIFVNGSFVGGTGKMEIGHVTYDSLFRQIYHIPDATLKAGTNEVTFIMVRNGIPYFDYFPPVIGEYSSMKTAFASTDFMFGPYIYIVFSAILIVTIFAFIFFVISGRERSAFWLFALAAGLTLTSHYYIWSAPPFRGLDRLAYYFGISVFVQYAWFGWADSWSRQSMRWPIRVATLAFILCGGFAIASLYLLPAGAGYDQAGEIIFYSGIGFAIATAIRLVFNFRDLQEDRYLEAAIALLLVSLLALQSITELTQALNMGYVSRTQPFIILGIAVAFFARKVRLFKSSGQINSLLRSQLDERTAELEVAHTREKRLVRSQALDEERQRIMRDMHDGLGSHLMSMLMMAKRGKAKHEEYADGLQLVIDEMRLMIDSMDSVGESLRAALAIFKKRVVPRARDAGFAVTWSNTADDVMPDYGPREVLQIFRILQEAVTNALKHSGGDAIAITLVPSKGDDFALDISIADNGAGLGDPQQRGRGLCNMKNRAAGIGAELTVADKKDGAQVLLRLPMQAEVIAV